MDGDDKLKEEVERGNRLAKHLAEHLKWMGANEAEFQYVDDDGSIYHVKVQRDSVDNNDRE